MDEIASLAVDRRIRPLPSPIPELLGIVGLRGAILPVYDLARLLGYPAASGARWLAVLAAAPVGLAFAAFDGYLVRPGGSIAFEAAHGDSRHVRVVARAADFVRPVISLASVLDAIRQRLPDADGLGSEQVTMRRWTFGQRIALGFGLTVALTAIIGVVSVLALRTVVQDKDRVIDVDARALIDAHALVAARHRKASATRQFFLTRGEDAVRELSEARSEIARAVAALERGGASDQAGELVRAIERLEQRHQTAVEQVLALRRTDAPLDQVVRAFEGLNPIRDELDEALRSFVALTRAHLAEATKAASDAAASAQRLIIAIAVLVALLGAATAFVLARPLSRQIGTAVRQVQSSSAELQAAANQQATGAKEQATAMSEITTTISELLATSRQIAESAQRVAQIAEQTGDRGPQSATARSSARTSRSPASAARST